MLGSASACESTKMTNMSLRMALHMTKMRVTSEGKTTTQSKTQHLPDVSESMAPQLLKIHEKRDTVDKLYMSRFFVIHPCKPKTSSNNNAKNAPRSTPTSEKIQGREKKQWWHRCWYDAALRKAPRMTPNQPKWHPWAAQGLQKAPQDRPRDPQKAPQGRPRDPKGHPKAAPGTPKGTPRPPQGP